jgi:hypothetical protein
LFIPKTANEKKVILSPSQAIPRPVKQLVKVLRTRRCKFNAATSFVSNTIMVLSVATGLLAVLWLPRDSISIVNFKLHLVASNFLLPQYNPIIIMKMDCSSSTASTESGRGRAKSCHDVVKLRTHFPPGP